MYIIFEGIDGCGKTTQIELLAKEFKDVIITKEPGGTEFGKIARDILLGGSLSSKRAELFLFLADRAEHYSRVIEPNRDRLIFSDRGFLSGIGYALVEGSSSFDFLLEMNRFALNSSYPDLIIFFKTDIETLQIRLNSADNPLDGIELRGLDYLMRVQDAMYRSLKRLDIPFLTIDATKDKKSIYGSIFTEIKSLKERG